MKKGNMEQVTRYLIIYVSMRRKKNDNWKQLTD